MDPYSHHGVTNGANLQCHVPTPGTPPFPAHLCHPTPADHSSGSLAAETLDEPFSLGPHAFFFHQATSSWGWGLVSLSGCGLSSTGLARSYVYCGSAQEEGIGNSVGGGIRAFRDWKRFLLGTPPRAGHRPRPLLFVWAQEDGNSLCFGGQLQLLFRRSGK